MIVWPVYFVLVVFAPTLLGVFGVGFGAGSTALVITSLAMLVATAVGPVDIVLLMAGRSVWNLFNVAVATVLNLALGIVLVPKIGVTGAAIGLAASLIYNNLAPALQVRRFMRIHPFGRGFLTIAPVSALCFGVAGLATRLMIGSSPAVVAAFVLVATCTYGCAIWMLRDRLELHAVFSRE
jgi:O-antigen/teichoic acid export membrane protein